MIQKLTANLKRSQQYGRKIKQQVGVLSSQIINYKIGIAASQKSIAEGVKQLSSLNIELKKQSEQLSSYGYKMQKLDIRLKEYNRKVLLQEEIYNKKILVQQSLKSKIDGLQRIVRSQNKLDLEILSLKNEIEKMDNEIKIQQAKLENLLHDSMNINKTVRLNEDQLQLKRNWNRKKMEKVSQCLKSHPQVDKQNINTNRMCSEQQKKLENLKNKKNKILGTIVASIDSFVKICEDIDQVNNTSMGIKKQLSKELQLVQEAKNQKYLLLKAKDHALQQRTFN